MGTQNKKKRNFTKKRVFRLPEEMYDIFARGGRIHPLSRHLHPQALQFTRKLVHLLLQDHNPLSQLISICAKW